MKRVLVISILLVTAHKIQAMGASVLSLQQVTVITNDGSRFDCEPAIAELISPEPLSIEINLPIDGRAWRIFRYFLHLYVHDMAAQLNYDIQALDNGLLRKVISCAQILRVRTLYAFILQASANKMLFEVSE